MLLCSTNILIVQYHVALLHRALLHYPRCKKIDTLLPSGSTPTPLLICTPAPRPRTDPLPPSPAPPAVHWLPRVYPSDGIGEGRRVQGRGARGGPDAAAELDNDVSQLGSVCRGVCAFCVSCVCICCGCVSMLFVCALRVLCLRCLVLSFVVLEILLLFGDVLCTWLAAIIWAAERLLLST